MKKRQPQMQKRAKDPEGFSHRPFKNLDKLYRNTVACSGSAMLETCKSQQKSEDEIFRDAMKEVREIREFRAIAVRKRSSITPRKCQDIAHEVRAELEGIVSGKFAIRLTDTQEYVEWANPKYNRELIRDLREGKFAVQDCIDLHGLVLEAAEEVLRDFLAEARLRGYHCIKIIHGRGLRSQKGPVLKNAVITLLSSCYRKQVIGFTSARKNDGGLGAIYVLIA